MCHRKMTFCRSKKKVAAKFQDATKFCERRSEISGAAKFRAAYPNWEREGGGNFPFCGYFFGGVNVSK